MTTNKQPPASPSVVYTGKLEEAGSHIWGGNNYIADFSDFRQEGLFWMRLKVEETCEVAESYVFRIGKSLCLDLAKKAARWLYYQRCGCEVPGWYKACHTEDAIILENGERIDATGGWHDAGDYGKWIGAGTTGVLALANRCISIAKEIQAIAAKMDPSKPEYEKEAKSYLTLQTWLLLSDVELYQISKERKYREDAQKRVREILALQDKEGFFYEDKARSSGQMRYHFYLVSLYEFLKQHPDRRFNPDIEEAFRRWANYMEPFAQLSNFGQVGSEAEDGSMRNMARSANRDLGCFAWGMATAAMLFEESKYLEIAERQIQWIVGFNPSDVSMMAGVGREPGCYHHRYCFIEGHEDGVVPGGVLNGMAGGTGEVFQIGDIRTGHFVVSDGLPVDYPVLDTDGWGWSYAHHTDEYWTINNAWFIMGTLQVEKAMRKLR